MKILDAIILLQRVLAKYGNLDLGVNYQGYSLVVTGPEWHGPCPDEVIRPYIHTELIKPGDCRPTFHLLAATREVSAALQTP